MSVQVLRCAVLSAGDGLRAVAEAAVARAEEALGPTVGLALVVLEGDTPLLALAEVDPDVVVLRVADGRGALTAIASATADAPGRQVIAVGPPALPEVMLGLMRAGAAEYLPEPLEPHELAGALVRTAKRLSWAQQREPKEPGQLLAVYSPKGGTGVSGTAVNLALEIRRLSARRTLLLDLDLELGSVAALMGLQPRYSPVDLILNYHRMDEGLLTSFMELHEGGLEVLPAPSVPEQAGPLTREQVRTALSFLRRHYEYVVIDLPRSISVVTLAVLESADRVLLLATPDLPTLRNVKRTLPLLERLVAPGGRHLQLLLNGCRASDEVTPPDAARALGKGVHRALPFEEDVRHSVNVARPVVLGGASRFAREIRAEAAEIVGVAVMNGRAPKPERRLRLANVLRARGARHRETP